MISLSVVALEVSGEGSVDDDALINLRGPDLAFALDLAPPFGSQIGGLPISTSCLVS